MQEAEFSSETMAVKIKAGLEEANRPSEDMCRQMLGRAHVGIVILPQTEDSFEQPQITFFKSSKMMKRQQSIEESKQIEPSNDHRSLQLLLFGGSMWAQREPN